MFFCSRSTPSDPPPTSSYDTSVAESYVSLPEDPVTTEETFPEVAAMMLPCALEYVPLVVALFTILPVTFELVRWVLEDKLDLDIVFDMVLLRAMEVIITVALLPTATVLIVLFISWNVLKKVTTLSGVLAEHLSSPGNHFVEAFYYFSNVLILLALLTLLIIIITQLLSFLNIGLA